MNRVWTILLLLAIGSIFFVACDAANDAEPGTFEDEGLGDEDLPTDAVTVDVSLTEYQINMPTSLQSGPTEFVVTNTGTEAHNFEVEGQGIEEEFEADLLPGETGSLQIDLEPGSYTIYCPVDDHREMGMELVVTVQ